MFQHFYWAIELKFKPALFNVHIITKARWNWKKNTREFKRGVDSVIYNGNTMTNSPFGQQSGVTLLFNVLNVPFFVRLIFWFTWDGLFIGFLIGGQLLRTKAF